MKNELTGVAADVRNCLYEVVDPEISCNIVDLGMVYDVIVRGDTVVVQLAPTSPGCPMQDALEEAIKRMVKNRMSLDVEVEFVWDPPWNPSLISPAGREIIGID